MTGVGILITGNEVLFGKTRDTNGPHMASALRKVGAEVRRSIVCGDDREEILRSFDYLFEAADVVLMTGGLGPTSDDLTAELVARYFALPLEFNDEAWQACIDAFARMGRKTVPETNRKQARLPKGCQLLPNPNGTAVGFRVEGEVKGRRLALYALPGVPFEMEPMFATSVLPNLTAPGCVSLQRTWQVFGLGESAMQERVAVLEARIAEEIPTAVVAYQAHAGYVTYSVFVAAPDATQAARVAAFLDGIVASGVRDAFGHHVVSESELALAPFVVSTFGDAGLSLAVAESCTGGALSKEITAVAGSSRCFQGGITTYANDWKRDFLGVPAEVIATHGAVSEQTAAAMAVGMRARAGVDIAVSITGVAGPGGGSEQTPVGTVCFGIAVRSARVPMTALAERLGRFKWRSPPSADLGEPSHAAFAEESSVITLTTTASFGARSRREVIQMRAVVFALGSLAVLAGLVTKEPQ